jgi:hypothetical protein
MGRAAKGNSSCYVSKHVRGMAKARLTVTACKAHKTQRRRRTAKQRLIRGHPSRLSLLRERSNWEGKSGLGNCFGWVGGKQMFGSSFVSWV